jgi:Flp pilus assembly protein TadB
MNNPKTFEFLRTFALSVAILALLALGYGVYQWYSHDQRINEIDEEVANRQAVLDEVVAEAQSQDEVISALGGQDFMAGDIALRREKIDKQGQRDDAIRMIGFSIAAIAGAWLVRDLAGSRLKKLT